MNYPIPSVFNKPPMAFRAITMRVVKKFFIVFRNYSPMFHAIYASASRTIEGGPKLFEAV